jgi:hypothetical protein
MKYVKTTTALGIVIVGVFMLLPWAYAATGQSDFSQSSQVSITGGFNQELGTSTASTYGGVNPISTFTAKILSCDVLGGTAATFSLFDNTAAAYVYNGLSNTHSFTQNQTYTETWNFTPYVFLDGHDYRVSIGILGSSCVQTFGSSASSSWPFGNATNNDTGFTPVPVQDIYFTSNFDATLTSGNTPSTPASDVLLLWPGTPGSFSVPGFAKFHLFINNFIPLGSSTGAYRESLSIRYRFNDPLDSTSSQEIERINSISTDGAFGTIWRHPASGDVYIPTSPDLSDIQNATNTPVYAQPVYTIQYSSSGVEGLKVVYGGLYHFNLSSNAPEPSGPYAVGTGPYSRNPALLVPVSCDFWNIFGYQFPDPVCTTVNAIKRFGSDAMTTLKDGVSRWTAIFPINIFKHLSDDFAAAADTTTSTDVQFKFIDKTYTVLSSTSLTSAADSIGFTGYRSFFDYLMYALTGVFIIVVGILAVSWLTTKE